MSSHHKLTESEDYVYGAEHGAEHGAELIIYGRLGISSGKRKTDPPGHRHGKATPYSSL
jgi:hypothetical protein